VLEAHRVGAVARRTAPVDLQRIDALARIDFTGNRQSCSMVPRIRRIACQRCSTT
jgi:hypothetical protein